MTVLPLAEARAHLSEIVAEAESTHERYEITKNGRPAAVLLSAEDYEAMRETMAVLADTELMRAHREGQAAIAAGDYLDADQLAEQMRRAGRSR